MVNRENGKGLHIVQYNFFMIILTFLLSVGMIFVSVVVAHLYDALDNSTEEYILWQKNSTMVGDASDYLTDQVRFFAHDFNITHVHLYFEEAHVTKRRDRVLEAIQRADIHLTTAQLLTEAIAESNRLMKREIYAMALICHAKEIPKTRISQEILQTPLTAEDLRLPAKEQIDKAQTLLFDEEYTHSKSFIMTHVDRALEEILFVQSSERNSLSSSLRGVLILQRIIIVVFVLSSLASVALTSLLVMRPLRIFMRRIARHQPLDELGSYETRRLAKIYNYIYAAKDAGEAREVALRWEAEHDPLTGLMNRKVFSQLDQILKEYQAALALIIIDVDHFKSINDKYGHPIGDLALIKLADLLKTHFRSQDHLFRIGGDEFVVVVRGVSHQNYEIIKEKISVINEALSQTKDGLPRLSVSAGVGIATNGFHENLFKEADEALYRAKDEGRSTVEFYDESFTANA